MAFSQVYSEGQKQEAEDLKSLRFGQKKEKLSVKLELKMIWMKINFRRELLGHPACRGTPRHSKATEANV